MGGDVLCSEARETKRGGNKIFSFNISDYTSSMTVKMFDSNKVMDPVINKIQSAKTVMVSGMYQYDNYAGEYVLRANSLATVTKMEKMDTAPEKRVELHMHTSPVRDGRHFLTYFFGKAGGQVGPQGGCDHRPRRGAGTAGGL